MKKQIIYKIHRSLIMACLFIIFGVSGCAGFNPKAVEEAPREDIILAMKIKAKLIEIEELKAAAIHVEVTNGWVVISGFVDTRSQRQLAASIAQQVANVKQVDNQIKVK
ncbi:BON domain-containing protein [Nitrosomonas supralitoralis]|nr:BON domain-containing protein [Nitrosomonas supralitoralis]